MQNESLQSSDKGISHGQKTKQIQNVHHTLKQKSECVNSQTQTLYWKFKW